ncbi:pyruvate kinase [Reyranella sp.]|jgi:pyruvate kinase|uniref:pyruvate kinase n=1 Tax=Reyranella sp. TaxID=1929291 RepID=UPI0027203894|nr:pyruvate kinase [Reyranella sp.]MDO8973605.1 pyruvate kinase [Reyranella sp.]
MRRNRFTKIVATLGPASSTTERLRTLFEAGADVFRLNFSHGQHEDHRQRVEQLRALEKEFKHPIAILLDLQGPKLRLGTFAKGPMVLKKGQTVRFDMNAEPGTAKRIPLLHPEIFKAAKPDGLLLIDDGKVRLRIVRHDAETIDAEAEVAGTLSDRKGVNLPNLVLPMSPMTQKDHKDLAFGLSLGVDWIALSFVQHANDIAELKKMVGGRAAVMAKLEKPQAIEHLDEIIEQSDGIMVARGDLGVEMPPEAVPPLQKRILAAARVAGRPTIVATQMLESMINAPTPTRAEVSDVATAVYDGTDAVMLSAESASGNYPLEAVTMMDRILKSVEADPLYRRLMDASRHEPEATTADAISAAARQCAHTLSAAAIVTYTNTGSTTLRAARERPDVRILCLTPNIDTARRMTLTWGVHPVRTEDAHNFGDMVQRAVRVARQEMIAKEGERLVVTAGVPFGTPGATNILRIAYV